MSAYLENWAWAWARWATAASWQIAVLVVLVALAAFLSRRLSARFRYLLWMLVVIKALTPPTIGAVWSIGNWAGPQRWESVSVRIESAPVRQEEAIAAVEPGEIAQGERTDGTYGSDGTNGTHGTDKNNIPWSASAILLIVWSAGFAGLSTFIVFRYWRLTRVLAAAETVDEGPLRVMLEKLALRLGRENPPALILSDAVTSPFLFGLVRPKIVLPTGLPDSLSAEQIEDVLLHELIHWRRRDVTAGWLQILVQAIFWFHPLVWLAGAQLRHERECACDEAVLESGCSQARRYGESLLRVLMAARGRSAVALGFLGIFERNTRLQRRLEEIMNQETRVRRLGVWSWLALALFAVMCLPMAAQNNPGPQSTKTSDAQWGNKLTENQLLFMKWTDRAFNPEKIKWWDSPKFEQASTIAGLAKQDQEFIDKIKGRKKVESEPSAAVLLKDTWIVTFKGKAPFKPVNAQALIATFNEKYPTGVQTHHFKTEQQGSDLIGKICVETTAGRDAVEKMLSENPKLIGLAAEKATPESFAALTNKANQPGDASAGPPRIVSTSPAVGATDVDPAIKEITVTFDRDMGGGMSWTGGGPEYPNITSRPNWRDARTCVLPVALEAGKFYRAGINSTSFQNFRSAAGYPAQPSAIYFTTKGASADLQAKTQKPQIVSVEPPNGSTGVDPNIKEIRVTFNVPMGGGMSWTGGGANFPEIPQGQRIHWTDDRKTCIRPVSLKPNWTYRLGFNSPSHKNFQSAGGVPLDPVRYQFSTK